MKQVNSDFTKARYLDNIGRKVKVSRLYLDGLGDRIIIRSLEIAG
jgi:hypothetical protein